VDILADNLQYKKPVTLNNEISKDTVSETNTNYEDLSSNSNSKSSSEDNNDSDSTVDFATVVNWKEQPITIDQYE
ncbi:16134_t:CDS:1, partial [Cetraspora pellucida]